MCDATVSYALLTRGPLPLWPVWEDYLQHCPHGSYTVVVHSQNVSTSWLPAQALRIPASSTAIGDLRFSWRMVGAMLSTVQQAQGTRAPNGCVPRWIHFASESCAPVRPCARVHASLAADTGVSRMELRRVPHQVPAGYGVPNPKASQWMTLWLAHASALAADPRVLRSAQAATWERGVGTTWRNETLRGAIDELLWRVEFDERGFPTRPRGLTYVRWPGPGARHRSRHPLAFRTRADAAAVCVAAHTEGYYFARKFAPVPGVFAALRECLRRG